MNGEKFISLLQSEEFLAKLNDAETVAEAKNLFQSEGLDISDEKIKVVMEALQDANKKAHNGEMLSEEDLESVSGGGFITKSLEIIILAAVLYEGVGVAKEIYDRGGVKRFNIREHFGRAYVGYKKARASVVDWATSSE